MAVTNFQHDIPEGSQATLSASIITKSKALVLEAHKRSKLSSKAATDRSVEMMGCWWVGNGAPINGRKINGFHWGG